jgi:uncharacterized damage-inducible protein DinB
VLNSSVASLSLAQQAVDDVSAARERFNRSAANLTEALSGFAPAEGTMTVAQHVAHAARVIEWFVEGASRSEGFDLSFEEQIKAVLRVESLSSARAWFEKAVAKAIDWLGSQSDAELMARLPPGPVLGGQPRFAIVKEIMEHTAHHRGALSVYSRLNHLVPPDPYGM